MSQIESPFEKINTQKQLFFGRPNVLGVCYFCGEPIIKPRGRDSESVCIHHLNGDPNDDRPENLVLSHFGCHTSYHNDERDHVYVPISDRRKCLQSHGGVLLCHFCDDPITKMRGMESDALLIHSLDGDHHNWDPENKVVCHRGCHQRYNMEGNSRPSMMGDRNPAKRSEVRIKISRALRGREHTLEHRRRLSDAMKGKTHSVETCRKMSKAKMGHSVSEETRRKISEGSKGRIMSKETRQKLSLSMGGEDGGAKRGWETRRRGMRTK